MESDPYRATFTPTADAGVLKWEREVEVMFREGHRLGHITEWGGKLVGATVRVATLLQFAQFFRASFIHCASAPTLNRF